MPYGGQRGSKCPWHRQVPHKFGLSSIAVKELRSIILAEGIWGSHWRGCTVCCCCDNEAVVSVVNSGACRDKQIAHLMRCVFFIEAHFDFSLVAKHVPGVSNSEADAISQNNLRAFFASNPQAHSSHKLSVPQMPDGGRTQLDVGRLDQLVQQHLRQALAPTTQSSYAYGQRRYLDFCKASACVPYPVTEDGLCRFVAYLADSIR